MPDTSKSVAESMVAQQILHIPCSVLIRNRTKHVLQSCLFKNFFLKPFITLCMTAASGKPNVGLHQSCRSKIYKEEISKQRALLINDLIYLYCSCAGSIKILCASRGCKILVITTILSDLKTSSDIVQNAKQMQYN